MRLAFLILVLIAPTSLSAQAANRHSRFGAFFGAGVELAGIRDYGAFDPGPAFQAGLTFQPTSSRLGARLEASLASRHHTGPSFSGSMHFAGLHLDGTFALRTGRTQPYLLAGLGVDATYSGSSYGGYVLPELGGTGQVTSQNQTSLSGRVGIGIQRRLGGPWFFVEVKLQGYTSARTARPTLLPLTLGLRF